MYVFILFKILIISGADLKLFILFSFHFVFSWIQVNIDIINDRRKDETTIVPSWWNIWWLYKIDNQNIVVRCVVFIRQDMHICNKQNYTQLEWNNIINPD